MTTVESIAAVLGQLAALELAESWDNVGLLAGDGRWEVRRIMTCLTVTPTTAAEAIDEQADFIVTHHPLPFQPLRRLTADSLPGRLLLDLLSAKVAVYSAHTAFDSAASGINQQLAVGLGLSDIRPLQGVAVSAGDEASGVGSGRYGRLSPPLSLDELAARVRSFLGVAGLHVVDGGRPTLAQVAVVCGSGGELLEAARRTGCDAVVTGEARFHACLEAQAAGLSLLLPGHYASERFALDWLAEQLQTQFPQTKVWASRRERDPLRWVSFPADGD